MRGSGDCGSVDLPSGPVRGQSVAAWRRAWYPTSRGTPEYGFPLGRARRGSGCADPTRVTRPRCFLGQNSKVNLPWMEPLGDMQPYVSRARPPHRLSFPFYRHPAFSIKLVTRRVFGTAFVLFPFLLYSKPHHALFSHEYNNILFIAVKLPYS